MPSDELDLLLDQVRRTDRSTRIELRDAVVACGVAAIEPMVEWLDDRELAAFAVRVLEWIGRLDTARRAVINALTLAYPTAPTPDVGRDIEAALGHLGGRLVRPVSGAPGRAARSSAPGRPGVAGRGYWAMRTSASYPEFIWAEVRRGRLRQGWGWTPEQDLRHVAERVRAAAELSPEERVAWPARRMLGTESDGIRLQDLIVTQNLPRQGHLSVCRVVGPYEFAVPDAPQDFGHILSVELLVEDVDRHDARVSDALRRAISLQPRLYEITAYGGDVDELVATASRAR